MKLYETPQIDIILSKSEDVITTSGGNSAEEPVVYPGEGVELGSSNDGF